eukprot:scaffold269362_cov13-Tisochrysis_lutea.AAC.1
MLNAQHLCESSERAQACDEVDAWSTRSRVALLLHAKGNIVKPIKPVASTPVTQTLQGVSSRMTMMMSKGPSV